MPAKREMSVSLLNMPLQTALKPSLAMRSMLPARVLALKMRSRASSPGSSARSSAVSRP